MTLKPYAAAQASIGDGPVNIEDAREYSWVGDGAYLMHNVLNQGQLVQFVVASYEKDAESSDRWHRTVSADEIKKLYQSWPPHLYKAVEGVREIPLPLLIIDSVEIDRDCSCCAISPNNQLYTSGSIHPPTPMYPAPSVSWATLPTPRPRGKAPEEVCPSKIA
jgi:hypothetical protein